MKVRERGEQFDDVRIRALCESAGVKGVYGFAFGDRCHDAALTAIDQALVQALALLLGSPGADD